MALPGHQPTCAYDGENGSPSCTCGPPSLHEADRDVTAMLRMLEWGRKNGFRIGPEVTVGCISAKVVDLRQTKKEGLMPQREVGIFEEHGMEDDE